MQINGGEKPWVAPERESNEMFQIHSLTHSFVFFLSF